jgi:hypothetical protein
VLDNHCVVGDPVVRDTPMPLFQSDPKFHPSQVNSYAAVGPVAKGQMSVWLSIDDKVVDVGKLPWVSTCRCSWDDDLITPFHVAVSEFGITGDHSRRGCDRVVAQELVDRRRLHSFRCEARRAGSLV